MKVKISDKLICIPPYISTTWDQVCFLQSEHELENKKMTLILHLIDGKVVNIPNLDTSIIDIAFSAHTQHLEKSSTLRETQPKGAQSLIPPILGISPDQMAAFQIRLGNAGGMEGLESAMQHNPAQANTPSLPKEIVEKIAAIAKILTNGDLNSFPKPEPHCNCVHCQVARSIHNLDEIEEQKGEESVTDEDLSFRSWQIIKTADNLYAVSNPIDPREHYSVYLGHPVGCTCGEEHCEHIRAVLTSYV